MATVWHHHAAELAGWDWTAIATIVVALVTLAIAGARVVSLIAVALPPPA